MLCKLHLTLMQRTASHRFPATTSTFLHIFLICTINHFDLSLMQNFPLLMLTPSVNLQLDIFYLRLERMVSWNCCPVGDDARNSQIPCWQRSKKVIWTTSFMDLGQLSISFLLQRLNGIFDIYCRKASYFERRTISLKSFYLYWRRLCSSGHLSPGFGWSLVGHHDILSPSVSTLYVFDLRILIYRLPVFVMNWKRGQALSFK